MTFPFGDVRGSILTMKNYIAPSKATTQDRSGALRVVQQIKKIGRTKVMTQSEILCQ